MLDNPPSEEIVMQSLADALPPELAAQIHPDWRENEAEYWAARDTLLAQFAGKWIGFCQRRRDCVRNKRCGRFSRRDANGETSVGDVCRR
jgi:hypothetical protein